MESRLRIRVEAEFPAAIINHHGLSKPLDSRITEHGRVVLTVAVERGSRNLISLAPTKRRPSLWISPHVNDSESIRPLVLNKQLNEAASKLLKSNGATHGVHELTKIKAIERPNRHVHLKRLAIAKPTPRKLLILDMNKTAAT